MDGKTHHLHKPVVIGEVNHEGQFDIVARDFHDLADQLET